MTVAELKDSIDRYLKSHSGNDEVLFCDDGMKPSYFSISAMGSIFDREVKPAVIEHSREKVGIKCNDDRFPGCSHRNTETEECLNSVWYTYNDDGTIDRSYGICPYYNPVYKEVPVQLEPPEYAQENIFMIIPLRKVK